MGVVHCLKPIEGVQERILCFPETVCLWTWGHLSVGLCVYSNIHDLEGHIHYNFLSDLGQGMAVIPIISAILVTQQENRRVGEASLKV